MKRLVVVAFFLVSNAFSFAESLQETTIDNVLKATNVQTLQTWISQNTEALTPGQAVRVFKEARWPWTWNRTRSLKGFLDARMATLSVDDFLSLVRLFDWNPTADAYLFKYVQVRASELTVEEVERLVKAAAWTPTIDKMLVAFATSQVERLSSTELYGLARKVCFIFAERKIRNLAEVKLLNEGGCPVQVVAASVEKPKALLSEEPLVDLDHPLYDAEADAR